MPSRQPSDQRRLPQLQRLNRLGRSHLSSMELCEVQPQTLLSLQLVFQSGLKALMIQTRFAS